MDIGFDFYPEPERGAYSIEVRELADVATPPNIAGESADVVYTETPVPPGAYRLRCDLLSPSTVGLNAVRVPGRVFYLYYYKTPDDNAMIAFDQRVSAEYTAYYQQHGIFYSGALRAHTPDGLAIAELLGFNADSREAAEALMDKAVSPRIRTIEAEYRMLQDRTQPRYRIWFTRQS